MGTFINALIGALAAVVLAFLPFSTVIGGAISGFLEGPDERDGAVVGVIAGALTLLPMAVLGMFGLGILGVGFGVAGGPPGGFVVLLFVFGMIASAIFVYTVVFSMLGGYLGAILAREYPDRRAKTRDTVGMAPDEPHTSVSEQRESTRVDEWSR